MEALVSTEVNGMDVLLEQDEIDNLPKRGCSGNLILSNDQKPYEHPTSKQVLIGVDSSAERSKVKYIPEKSDWESLRLKRIILCQRDYVQLRDEGRVFVTMPEFPEDITIKARNFI